MIRRKQLTASDRMTRIKTTIGMTLNLRGFAPCCGPYFVWFFLCDFCDNFLSETYNSTNWMMYLKKNIRYDLGLHWPIFIMWHFFSCKFATHYSSSSKACQVPTVNKIWDTKDTIASEQHERFDIQSISW